MDKISYKVYNPLSGKSYEASTEDGIVMPHVGLEDIDGRELFLYDVLLDGNNDGWILQFHEKGYLFLERIGSDLKEKPLPVMDVPNFRFGKHFYCLPMRFIGNSYEDNLHNSIATPNSCRMKLLRYLKKAGLMEKSDED